MADAAGGEHHGARGKMQGRPVTAGTRDDAGNAPALGGQALADIALEQADRRRLVHGGDERRHDGRSRHVAGDMDDAALGMGRLARHGELAGKVAVEGHAVFEQVEDALRRVGDHQAGDLLRHDAVAGGDGIGEVLLDGIAVGHGGGDAALRPGRGRPLADRRGGDDGYRPRRQAERGEQAAETAADDDDIVGHQWNSAVSRSIEHFLGARLLGRLGFARGRLFF